MKKLNLRSFELVVQILMFLFIGHLLSSTLQAQNTDIHSSDVYKQRLEIVIVADSLLACNCDLALDFCLNELALVHYTDKPDLYFNLLFKAGSGALQLGQINRADSLMNQILSLKIKNLHPILKSKILIHKSKAADYYNRKIEAIKFAKESLVIFNKNNDISGQVECNILLASLYHAMERNEISYNYYREALSISKKSNNPTLYFQSLLSGVLTLIDLNKVNEAKNNLTIAIELAQLVDLNTATGDANFLMGKFFYLQQNYSRATEYFEVSKLHYLEQTHFQKASNVITWEAAVSMRLQQYQDAVNYNQEAASLRFRTHSRFLEASSHFNIASALIELEDYDLALTYIEKGEKLYKTFKNRSEYIRGLELKQRLYYNQKMFREAFVSLEKRMNLQDSVFQLGNEQKLQELSSDFAMDQYEQQKQEVQTEALLQQMQKERNDIFLKIILLVFLLVLVASYLLFVHSRAKNRKNVIIASQKLIFIQMNSHFVFNALTAIQSLIYKKQIESAIHYLTIFSSLINKIMAVTNKKLVSLQTEVSFIMEFLQIQKLRFGDELKFQINIDDNIDMTATLVPPMLTYPFIEYAVEECVQNAPKNAQLIINIKKEGNHINYEIIDKNLNFINMDTCFIKRYGGQEILCEQLTKERISVYNQFFKSKIIFAETKVTIEGKEYHALQFRIKG
ncbi:MAG: hypothetical protein GQ527_01420 [Bacteroidales bacterium]|nr:hypothetical protein [Bacteroidales bacterium]